MSKLAYCSVCGRRLPDAFDTFNGISPDAFLCSNCASKEIMETLDAEPALRGEAASLFLLTEEDRGTCMAKLLKKAALLKISDDRAREIILSEALAAEAIRRNAAKADVEERASARALTPARRRQAGSAMRVTNIQKRQFSRGQYALGVALLLIFTVGGIVIGAQWGTGSTAPQNLPPVPGLAPKELTAEKPFADPRTPATPVPTTKGETPAPQTPAPVVESKTRVQADPDIIGLAPAVTEAELVGAYEVRDGDRLLGTLELFKDKSIKSWKGWKKPEYHWRLEGNLVHLTWVGTEDIFRYEAPGRMVGVSPAVVKLSLLRARQPGSAVPPQTRVEASSLTDDRGRDEEESLNEPRAKPIVGGAGGSLVIPERAKPLEVLERQANAGVGKADVNERVDQRALSTATKEIVPTESEVKSLIAGRKTGSGRSGGNTYISAWQAKRNELASKAETWTDADFEARIKVEQALCLPLREPCDEILRVWPDYAANTKDERIFAARLRYAQQVFPALSGLNADAVPPAFATAVRRFMEQNPDDFKKKQFLQTLRSYGISDFALKNAKALLEEQ